MPFPSAENASHEDMFNVLERLDFLLKRLPTTLPCKPAKTSKFAVFLSDSFSLSQEAIERTGDKCSAFSDYLKEIFGWDRRSTGNGTISFDEQGPGVLAMTSVFRGFLAEFPNNNVLKKWIIDVAIGAEAQYDASAEPAPVVPLKRKQMASATKGPKAKCGRKPNPLATDLVNALQDNDGKPRWQCVACGTIRSGNLQLSRILGHSSICSVLEKKYPELHQAAI